MLENFYYILIYIFIGEIFSIINWLFLTDKNLKETTNFIVYFILTTFLWPGVIIGKFINLGKFIMNNYD